MLSSLIRLISALCCAFVIVSFVLFAIAQSSHGSKPPRPIASGASAGNSVGVAAEQQPKRFIDDVARALNSPWHKVVSGKHIWLQHIIISLISLLLYGAVLGFIARLVAVRRF